MAEDSSQVITQLPAGTIPLSNFTPVPSATPVSPGMRQLVVQPGQPTPMATPVPAQDNATPVPSGTPAENTVTVTLPPGTIPVTKASKFRRLQAMRTSSDRRESIQPLSSPRLGSRMT